MTRTSRPAWMAKARSTPLKLLATCSRSLRRFTYNSRDFQVLMVPAFLLFSVWIGVGFFWILSTWLRQGAAWLSGARRGLWLRPSHQAVLLSALAFALLPGISVVLNYGSQDLSGDRAASDYARSVLGGVPEDSVLLADSDRSVFSLWYVRLVEQPERDVAVVAVPLLQFDWYLRDLRTRYPRRIPVTESPDVVDIMTAIVEHNDGRSGVFITYWDPYISERVNLTPFGGIYEATPRTGG